MRCKLRTYDNNLPPSWSVNLSWVNELLSSPPPKIPISKIIWKIFFLANILRQMNVCDHIFGFKRFKSFLSPNFLVGKTSCKVYALQNAQTFLELDLYMYRNGCHVANGKRQCLSLENDKSIARLVFSIFRKWQKYCSSSSCVFNFQFSMTCTTLLKYRLFWCLILWKILLKLKTSCWKFDTEIVHHLAFYFVSIN